MDIVLTNWAEAAYVANEFPTEFRDNRKCAIRLETGLRSGTGKEGAKGVNPHATKGHENMTANIQIGLEMAHDLPFAVRHSPFAT